MKKHFSLLIMLCCFAPFLVGAQENTKEEKEDAGLLARAWYVTTHEGVFHRGVAVSAYGDEIQLEDGSWWTVHWSDRYQLSGWLTSDDVIITPNINGNYSYPYKLVNIVTGASLQVYLASNPVLCHWIVSFDDIHDEVYLEDGSVWRINPVDAAALWTWGINDLIILGLNAPEYSGNGPNILINARTTTYVCGRCLN